MEDSSTPNKTSPDIVPQANYGGLALGILALLISFVLFFNGEENRFLFRIAGICFGLLAINLFISPFSKQLKKRLATRIFYWTIQLFSIIALVSLIVVVVFGMAAAPIFLCVAAISILISKLLSHYDVQNHFAIGLFISFTTTAIAFSFYGNSLIKWFNLWVIEGGDKRNSDKWTRYTRIFFGQGQIRYFVYCLYFLLIIVFTIMDLIGKFPTDDDQNFMFLTLQSFAAFVAFDTIAEKRVLMKPWVMLVEMVNDGLKKVKNTSLKELLDEEDEGNSSK